MGISNAGDGAGQFQPTRTAQYLINLGDPNAPGDTVENWIQFRMQWRLWNNQDFTTDAGTPINAWAFVQKLRDLPLSAY